MKKLFMAFDTFTNAEYPGAVGYRLVYGETVQDLKNGGKDFPLMIDADMIEAMKKDRFLCRRTCCQVIEYLLDALIPDILGPDGLDFTRVGSATNPLRWDLSDPEDKPK